MRNWRAVKVSELQRPITIVVASLLVVSIASVGQVQSEIDKDTAARAARVQAGPSDPSDPQAGIGGESVASVTSTTAAGGPVAAPSGGTPGSTVAALAGGVPNFGLKTQGVTATSVRIGLSYNVAGCGDAGPVTAMFGTAVAGDPKRAINAFTRYINDTGGIRGRSLRVDVEDDGGGGCPEKELAAARKMADDNKDFLVIPGLYTVADHIVKQKIPLFGGRDDPVNIGKIAPNGIGLFEPLDATFEAWASLGKYYLDTARHKACLVHPVSDESGDWNTYERVLVDRMRQFGLAFTDIIRYTNDLSTAQTQANTAVTRAKSKGCDQAWLLSGNPIAWIFFTQAATQNLWKPTWTFTSYTALADSDLAGSLMDQNQWANAIGLSARVPGGQHPADGNCRRIYERYYGGDGAGGSAATQLICAELLTVAEIMRRAVDRTGVLTANSFLIGADSVKSNFYFDSHVPITWSIPSLNGPFKTKGFSHLTVARWNRGSGRYEFPEFPNYWRVMGPNRSGGEDLRSQWRDYKVPA